MSEAPERIWAGQRDGVAYWTGIPTAASFIEYVRADRAGSEPDFAKSIAEVINEQSLDGAACGWRPCTGCHETNEGAETGHYPYSKMFGCHAGSGCCECGGLGVVWHHISAEGLNAMASETNTEAATSSDGETLTDDSELLTIAYMKGAYDARKKAEAEIERLSTYFREEASSDGFEGDVQGWSPVETALSVMRRYKERAVKSEAERDTLAADNARLVEALEPFASAVARAEAEADRTGFAPSFDDYVVEWSFSFGQLRRARAALGASIPAPASAGSQPVKLTYTNWRGETSERTITPLRVYFGATEWHPEPQWLLRAFDHDKQAERDFALKDFGNTASADPAEARREALEEAANHARCAFDDRPRRGSFDWNDGFDDGTKAAAAALRALVNPAREGE